MKNKIYLFLCGVLAFVSIATNSSAESRVALIIGNGDYEVIGKLQNPTRDAALIAQTLSQVGFDVTVIYDQTEKQMGAKIDAFVNKARNADVAAFYYAGHGLQKDGENYLMPVDAQIRSEAAISREGIALNDLTAALANVPISLIFLDACRNNPFAEALMSSAQSQGRSAGIKRGLAVVQAPGDMLVTFATLPNTVASDGSGNNSPFASALADHIVTPDVEISVLMKRVTADVMAATERQQRPQQLSQMMTEFYFSRGNAGSTKLGSLSADTPVILSPERALLTVYPPRVTVGDEISVFADLDTNCTPSFFNLSPDRKFTPIPLRFFKKTTLDNSQIRFEISPGSRFGLVVQEQDEKGENILGYFCLPADPNDREAQKGILREIARKIGAGEEDGNMNSTSYGEIPYQARPYVIE